LVRPPQHGADHGRRATDAGLDGDGAERTIPAACAALHAGIAIADFDMPGVHLKHRVRADLQAHSATGAFGFIKFQGNHIFEIRRMIHIQTPKKFRLVHVTPWTLSAAKKCSLLLKNPCHTLFLI
jgi:hypothetical protein